jgi:hypothetical protein
MESTDSVICLLRRRKRDLLGALTFCTTPASLFVQQPYTLYNTSLSLYNSRLVLYVYCMQDTSLPHATPPEIGDWLRIFE